MFFEIRKGVCSKWGCLLIQELMTAVESKQWNEMIRFQQESEKMLNAALDMDE